MKKYLSILFTAIFAAMFVFSTTSCSKDDSATDANIVGTWKRVDDLWRPDGEEGDQYWQFKKNGTWIEVETDAGCIAYGTWRLSGNILTLILESKKVHSTESYKINELTKESMTFAPMYELDELDELLEAEFKRVPDSEIKKYLENCL